MDQRELRSPDVYGRTFEMDQAGLDAIAARLEARGRHPFFRRVVDEYMAELALSGDEAILDLGCGTGVAARLIAGRADIRRPITAIDISAQFIATAIRLARDEGLGERIGFRVGDAHSLGLAAGGFDVVVMHTLISHVADPRQVLGEAWRLLRPGAGRVVVFDGDYASITFATDAADGGEASDRAVQATVAANPRVLRLMPRLLAEAGFALVSSRGYVVADVGRADFFAPSVASYRVLLPRAGVMSEAEAAAFADGLELASAQTRFFAASNFYTYIARANG